MCDSCPFLERRPGKQGLLCCTAGVNFYAVGQAHESANSWRFTLTCTGRMASSGSRSGSIAGSRKARLSSPAVLPAPLRVRRFPIEMEMGRRKCSPYRLSSDTR